jgi:hypothetical protein
MAKVTSLVTTTKETTKGHSLTNDCHVQHLSHVQQVLLYNVLLKLNAEV